MVFVRSCFVEEDMSDGELPINKEQAPPKQNENQTAKEANREPQQSSSGNNKPKSASKSIITFLSDALIFLPFVLFIVVVIVKACSR